MNYKKITVASHLVNRLSEIGIKHIFGVPGDYNLEFLDYIIAHPKVTWVGNTNELNAAYAADGYARQSGAAALLTTYGVGELSAINGIAGAYAEHVPILHIVGSPLDQSEWGGELLHHTLGDGIFDHFITCAKQVTIAQTKLTSENAIVEIDRVLDAMLLEKRPAYIELPLSVVHSEIQGRISPYQPKEAVINTQVFEVFTQQLTSLLKDAVRPILLAGFLVESFGLKNSVRSLIKRSNIPNASLFMGKGILDETLDSYVGNYSGSSSDYKVLHALEHSDLILSLGVKYTDNITAGFSSLPNPDILIDFQTDFVTIKGKKYSGIPLKTSINLLLRLISHRQWEPLHFDIEHIVPPTQIEFSETLLTQKIFWQAVQSFLRDGDCMIAEQGTSFFGSAALKIGPNTSYIGQPLWGSIGYTLPATYGAMTAQPTRRTLLFIGDGSALLTLQELSSILRDALHPIIFLINNHGYTVERAIHGKQQRYNDIPTIDWQHLPASLGPGEEVKTYNVYNSKQLMSAFDDANKSNVLRLIEIHLDAMDLPPQLRAVSERIMAKNANAIAVQTQKN